jgi:hypothetical protein
VDGESQESPGPEPPTAGQARAASHWSDPWRGLFESALVGFAVHDIVLDEAGAPADYVFVSANRASGDQTGLVSAAIHGRRVTDVASGVERSGSIELYGRVAVGGDL